MSTREYFQTFRRVMLPSFSGPKLQTGDEGCTILRNFGTCRLKRRNISEGLNIVAYSPRIIRQQPAVDIITATSGSYLSSFSSCLAVIKLDKTVMSFHVFFRFSSSRTISINSMTGCANF